MNDDNDNAEDVTVRAAEPTEPNDKPARRWGATTDRVRQHPVGFAIGTGVAALLVGGVLGAALFGGSTQEVGPAGMSSPYAAQGPACFGGPPPPPGGQFAPPPPPPGGPDGRVGPGGPGGPGGAERPGPPARGGPDGPGGPGRPGGPEGPRGPGGTNAPGPQGGPGADRQAPQPGGPAPAAPTTPLLPAEQPAR